MAEFKFSCPHCSQHVQCDERLCRKQIQCPACQHLIVVPLSPALEAQGSPSVESGRTWDTFLPGARKPISPPPSSGSPDKPKT